VLAAVFGGVRRADVGHGARQPTTTLSLLLLARRRTRRSIPTTRRTIARRECTSAPWLRTRLCRRSGFLPTPRRSRSACTPSRSRRGGPRSSASGRDGARRRRRGRRSRYGLGWRRHGCCSREELTAGTPYVFVSLRFCHLHTRVQNAHQPPPPPPASLTSAAYEHEVSRLPRLLSVSPCAPSLTTVLLLVVACLV
jgi:hypothetical protein